MATYSGVDDVKIGNIPLPRHISKEALVQDAADEIDSVIGFVYSTPVDMAEDGPTTRPARLLLKRISTHLVNGRLILESAAAQEDTQLHAYGLRLVTEAQASLAAIASREIVLEGADLLDGQQQVVAAPLIANVDPISQVEAFYGHFTGPRVLPRVP